MKKPKKIVFITGNMHKLREARQILTDYDVVNKKIDLDELQGERRAIVMDKAKRAAKLLKKPVFVEDTCLAFDFLAGLPGPYIKDFLGGIGVDGLWKLASKYRSRKAKAICSIGYCEPRKEPHIFEGIIPGKIVSPKGSRKFGWDPIFMPEGKKQTFGQMGPEEKNQISHRKKAFTRFRNWLKRNK